ncbi:DUF4358 domain-containing protein [Pseudoflavonifractor sp. AF19-9AC]|uniref:DUF4358 domain-containing protein n=1 Tax=Pseudoflavonifractor sp. AF19-9AC TaxID=2292244 RepID=UPI000E4C304F|nr:DUF4358 domain-containing protein [Pseudoflavonifractor sp. AF19-9AC]RHR11148.1 DUF4358 domain-containing protein [Pseudoflavonifractor sp. AF19-9AC]
MKKILAFALTLALSLTVLAGCSSGTKASDKTPEELTQLYTDAITANGGEMVEYNPVISEISEEDPLGGVILESLGLTQEDMTAFAISMSMMNVKAYGIAAIMPAEGKEETVAQALQGYIDRQQQNFETYLADQYEVAKNAHLETLEDGTVLMVMCEGQDAVFEGISSSILGK